MASAELETFPLRRFVGLLLLVIAVPIVIRIVSVVGMVLMAQIAYGLDDTAEHQLHAALVLPGAHVAVRMVPRGGIIADSNSFIFLRDADIQEAIMERSAVGADVLVTPVPASRQRIRWSLSDAQDGHTTFINGHSIQAFRATSLRDGKVLLVTRIDPRLATELVHRPNARVVSR